MSITLSLIAVFIPLFLMGGYVGLLFREFAVTVSVALVLSLLISLTLDADDVLAPAQAGERGARTALPSFRARLRRLLEVYEAGLKVVLRHRFITLHGRCSAPSR